MNKLILTCVVSAALPPAQAQLFSPEAFTGAALGALIGGIAGGDGYYHGCHYHSDFSGEGAAIGAGVGLLAGALAGEARRQHEYDSPGHVYAPGPAPSVSFGYGYPGCGSSAYVYYSPNYYTAPGYYYRPTRPNYAVNGTLLGAASGALIGAGTGDAGLGAGIGAAAGLVVGGIAEHAAQKREQRISITQQTAPALQPRFQVQPRTSQNKVTSRPCPTSTYYWTTPPAQIPDVSRVPDAPSF